MHLATVYSICPASVAHQDSTRTRASQPNIRGTLHARSEKGCLHSCNAVKSSRLANLILTRTAVQESCERVCKHGRCRCGVVIPREQCFRPSTSFPLLVRANNVTDAHEAIVYGEFFNMNRRHGQCFLRWRSAGQRAIGTSDGNAHSLNGLL